MQRVLLANLCGGIDQVHYFASYWFLLRVRNYICMNSAVAVLSKGFCSAVESLLYF